jgi:hypothetical protein
MSRQFDRMGMIAPAIPPAFVAHRMSLPPDEIRRELAPLEQVVWSGRPRQGLVLRGSDVIQIPFSIFWCGFVAFWEHGAIESGNVFMMFWGIPFIVVGLYLIVGRFFLEAWQRAYTFYAVTGQRVLIVTSLFRREVKSIELATLAETSLSEARDGRGSIMFGPSRWPGSARQPVAPRFDMIDGARGVQQTIRETAARFSR